MATQGERKQDLVEVFCQDEAHVFNLVYVKNLDSFALYQQQRGFYKILGVEEMQEYTFRYLLKTTNKDLGPMLVRDIVTLAKWLVYRKIESEISDYVAFTDKVLNLNTFEFEDFHYEKNAFYTIRCSSEEVASGKESPRFTQFLDEIIVDGSGAPDRELQGVVQEMFGYCLLNTVDAHAMFFLVGRGGNGKGKLLSLLREIIGNQFITSMSIEYLTTNQFAVADLIGKKLNLCNEDESKFIRSDKFKALVAGDEVQARRIYQQSFSMKPSSKFIFATNEIPTFTGFNEGLLRRVNIIPFNHVFKEDEMDRDILTKLLSELPAIVKWAIDGAKRLKENNLRFTKSKQMAQTKEEFEKMISSSVLFLSENFVEETNCNISNKDLYFEYTQWCSETGKKPIGYHRFLKDIEVKLTLPPANFWSAEQRKSVRGRQLKRKDTEAEISQLITF